LQKTTVRSVLGALSALVFITVSASAQTLPSSWASRDIGTVGVTGTASGSNGSFNVDGGGADVWGTADAFRFAYTQMTGDGTIQTRVTGVENINAWTKAGVMVRETLNVNSKHGFMLVSPGKGLAFQRRTATGGSSANTGVAGKAAVYLRITRTGQTLRGYYSTNGSTWTLLGSATMNMTATVYVGLAVSSHVKGSLALATFDHTTVTATPAAAQPPPPPAPTGTGTTAVAGTLRVLHWNTYHGGRRTDGVYDPAGLVSWIVRFNPDVMTLNEVDNSTLANTIMTQLRAQKPGIDWQFHYDLRGNMTVSRLPIKSKSLCMVNSTADRQATHLSVTASGRTVNVWNAHLALDSSSMRTSETRAIQRCQQNWAEARIVAGDFNMQPETAEYKSMTEGHVDAFKAAKALGTFTNYSGNCDGCTRNSRIDYIFTSKGASTLALKSLQIFDTRNSKGVMASDHKPMLAIYTIK
jgi:endonuclease/exonuclease/phosphatase family metal-dependent hydrolase/regulation of enolase protein 1 (concanavalin A-like superfamily)